MKIYLVTISDQGDFELEKQIVEAHGHELIRVTAPTEDAVAEKCADADAVLDIFTRIGEKAMAAMPGCKVIVRYGIGYDNIDVDAATKRGIAVCNIPHYCIPEVAIHAVTLMLACARNLHAYDEMMRKNNGIISGASLPPMHRPCTQTVGLIGFGNIARKVASYLKGLEFNVEAYDPFLPETVFEQAGVKRVEFDELLQTADLISIHTALTETTYHILNREAFAKMKDGVIIVNTARGPLIEEEALIDAIRCGKVASAGLDVLEKDPLTTGENPFADLQQVITTPHVAFNTVESSVELHRQVAQAAVDVLDGKVLPNIVNKKALGLM